MHIDLKGSGISGFSIGIDPTGREHVVVITKRRLNFPAASGGVCTWSDAIPALCTADEFSGEPGMSAVTFESEFAMRKPHCDVLVHGAAYAPNGAPTPMVYAGLQCGTVSKTIAVFGPRVWERYITGPAPSEPALFVRQDISYDHAFGGVDALDPSEKEPPMYPFNIVGVGWHQSRNRDSVDGTPLPACEDPQNLISTPWSKVTPVSFGPIARGAPERAKYAGTYDEAWIEDRFPHLPDDYDDRYAQAAPADQQIRHPSGGEVIKLNNMMSDHAGPFEMKLPNLDLPVVFSRRRGEDIPARPVTDTLIIEPDQRHIDVITRASLPLKRDILEMREAIIGKRGRGYWRARALGKTYNPSLAGLGKDKVVPEL
ncbi:hypothetical protein FHS72_002872 [Loktanella ponticola]|uniref:DUF2169 domain-containing protein n=1 Tax=Yoonia ponticola TaxID=1524255 RepID=A0A7W9EYX9_9RHOB|nr:DUF2169 domain-containing protein [Yoonia ponticola]MBB5723232.1 hypothetical protein [Yoonia ponticola]